MSMMFLDVSRSARKPWRFSVRIYGLLCVYLTSSSPAHAANSTTISATKSRFTLPGHIALWDSEPDFPSGHGHVLLWEFLNLVPVAGIPNLNWYSTLDQSACVPCTSPPSQCGVGHPIYVHGSYNSVAVYVVTFWCSVQVFVPDGPQGSTGMLIDKSQSISLAGTS